jgi:hypothetical protein
MRLSLLEAAAAAFLVALTVGAAHAKQWDMTAGSYHTHLIFHDDRFELHLHDKATHGTVDTSKGRYTATLLAGGKTTAVPVTASKTGIITGRPVPKGDWVLLFRVEAPGRAPVQVRYASSMKTSGQTSADKKSQDGHAHDHQH